MSHPRRSAAGAFGFWIFFLGLTLIVAAFALTLCVFLGVDEALRSAHGPFANPALSSTASPATAFFVSFGAKLAALLVMAICASLIASQGLRLWFTARALPERPPAPGASVTTTPEPTTDLPGEQQPSP